MLGRGPLLGGSLGGAFAQAPGINSLILLASLLGSGALVTLGLLHYADRRVSLRSPV